MAADWLAALCTQLAAGQDIVLVTVAGTQGSAPREAGATMLVGADSTMLTIGGGHLEWQAIAQARRRLTAENSRPQVQRYNLGARLGQCCGGVVWLLFENIAASSLAEWQARRDAVEGGASLQRRLDHRAAASSWTPDGEHAVTKLVGGPEEWQFSQKIAVDRFPVWIFGAGHVAQALVRQLQPLGCAISWIDSRDEAFADLATDGIDTRLTDTPESEVAQAPAGTFFIIMTHSHTLDFALCEAVYRRRDFAYFGLIGSQSKRASFEHRLLDRGLARERLEELTCPIGIAGIVSKQPAAIALAVGAEILQIHHARQLLTQAARPRLSASTIQPE
ncbi:xanthine dehydrogenase accessory protein XdhC [Quatrionicoccus australiensis]|uniref:xanthine dehydrogenase accessory protein XdhC n=1 Tax=Quatrionicoccus australiensis TaxID=138118 RepID=UPI001CF8CD45|nr:xanthine dehydrogenase accessory protein XdhC [Quatrionicoccus australiensis]UCV13748.1 xanthine dehydrogenase accessory protein XdhC [Quatrionicoccus australiensis]